MSARRLAGLSIRLGVVLIMAGTSAAAIPDLASASTCVSWTGTLPANPSSSGDSLSAVTVLSPCDVLVVGDQQAGTASHTLAERWNGLGWTTTPSANPGGSSHDSSLSGVAAASATTAWAVGDYSNGTANQTLIETLSGTVWEQESSPDPGGPTHSNDLSAAAATSAKNAWAVGSYSAGTRLLTLIEHWNGTTWSQVPSPSPGSGGEDSELLGVTATSATNAWAVGFFTDGAGGQQTLIEHWNGTAWKRVPTPDPGGPVNNNSLSAVAASSASSAWAVGWYFTSGGASVPLALRWNGRAWKRVPTPRVSGLGGSLAGVTVLSPRDAWAVGSYISSGNHTLAEHWNGRAWARLASPDLGTFDVFSGVASSGPATVWAVGTYDTGGPDLTLAFHCC